MMDFGGRVSMCPHLLQPVSHAAVMLVAQEVVASVAAALFLLLSFSRP